MGPKKFFREFYLYFTLDIVERYQCMQFQEKLMSQNWENSKKPSFWPHFGPFGQNLGRQIFFSKIWLRQSLDVMVSYHHVQYQKKLMIQSWENLVTDRLTDESNFIGASIKFRSAEQLHSNISPILHTFIKQFM